MITICLNKLSYLKIIPLCLLCCLMACKDDPDVGSHISDLAQKPLYPVSMLENAYQEFNVVRDSAFSDTAIIIDGLNQDLYLLDRPTKIRVLKKYKISTSKYGFGSERGSNKTPVGIHEIAGKFGDGAPEGMGFYDRRPTGKIETVYTDTTNVEIDPVTSRIMWLKGLENKNHTSYWRFVYIHGTHEEGLIGTPQSKGCIRMLNQDVIELFNMVDPGVLVNIVGPASEDEKDK